MFPNPLGSVMWPWQQPQAQPQPQPAPQAGPQQPAQAAPAQPHWSALYGAPPAAPGPAQAQAGPVPAPRRVSNDSGYGEDIKPFGRVQPQQPIASGSLQDVKPQLQRDVKPFIKPVEPRLPHVELDLGGGLKDVSPFGQDDQYTPEAGLQRAGVVLENLRTLLAEKNLGGDGGKRLETWKKELTALEDKIKAPKRFLIAVVGATGAGKSTLINSLLGQEVVPTNSMRACTATVSEIAYHDSDTIRAEVEFLSADDWRAELNVLLKDVIGDDGRVVSHTEEGSEAGDSWARIHSVYPDIPKNADFGTYCIAKMTVDKLLRTGIAASHLGRTIEVTANDSASFQRKIGRFVDSAEKDTGKGKKRDKDGGEKKKDKQQEYWPLIKVVRIFVKSAALQTGSVAVDLPGTADSNAARGRIARNYMKDASAMWIVCQQGRAVDDKTAQDLLGESFKRTLQMDGNLERLTFITTRSDDVSPREAARSIPSLREELEPLEAEQDELIREKKGSGLVTKEAKAELAEAIEKIRLADEDITEWESRLDAKQEGVAFVPKPKPKPKAQGSSSKTKGKGKGKGKKKVVDSDDSEDDSMDDFIASDDDSDDETPKKKRMTSVDSDDSDASDAEEEEEEVVDPVQEMSEKELEAIVKEKKAALKELRGIKKDKKAAVDAATAATTRIDKKLSKIQKTKNRLAALARNVYTRGALQQDFRVGLRQLDDANAEARDGLNWDPSIPQRDYDAITLPVFCCSSREFAKLTGLSKGDGKAQVFTKQSETGIPALRRHTKALTHKPRYQNAEGIIKAVADFASSVQLFLGADGMGGNDVASLRNAFRAQIGQKRLEFESFAQDGREHLGETFDTLENRIEQGCEAAAAVAEDTIQSFNDMHWCTYRATTRRAGVFSGSKGPKNFNASLIAPIMTELGSAWERAFSSPRGLIGSFEQDILKSVDQFARELSRSSADSSSARFDAVALQTKTQLINRLNQWTEAALGTIDTQQRESHRALEPAVQEALSDAYYRSAAERGTGSSVRMKDILYREVANRKDEIFSIGMSKVMDSLRDIEDSVEGILQKAGTDCLRIIEENFSTLWERLGHSDPRALALRKLALAAVTSELSKIRSVLSTTLPPPPIIVPGQGDDEEEDEEEEEPVRKADKKRAPKGKGKDKDKAPASEPIVLNDDSASDGKGGKAVPEKIDVRVGTDSKGRVVLEID